MQSASLQVDMESWTRGDMPGKEHRRFSGTAWQGEIVPRVIDRLATCKAVTDSDGGTESRRRASDGRLRKLLGRLSAVKQLYWVLPPRHVLLETSVRMALQEMGQDFLSKEDLLSILFGEPTLETRDSRLDPSRNKGPRAMVQLVDRTTMLVPEGPIEEAQRGGFANGHWPMDEGQRMRDPHEGVDRNQQPDSSSEEIRGAGRRDGAECDGRRLSAGLKLALQESGLRTQEPGRQKEIRDAQWQPKHPPERMGEVDIATVEICRCDGDADRNPEKEEHRLLLVHLKVIRDAMTIMLIESKINQGWLPGRNPLLALSQFSLSSQLSPPPC
ncbi:hypothetical protein BJ875DRAFT_542464 [Amylocarpus encephaloides]|uniref:Uncharacterized protein n=1 Tax=Amylocarpus encephaloides TaxID=45428 RepID=A0A9P7YJH8_9HELO|nr:hypothetical protein BJ875DRAFT_542464 [Amylocarpus encephaloides]